MVATERNPFISKGIRKYGRSKMYSLRRHYKVPKAEAKPKAAKPEKDSKIVFEGKYVKAEGGKRTKMKRTNKITKLRPSVVPGAVLIILSGRFMGSRVVFLKQLASGLLLVSGK
mmetsp:Transcript_10085/g.18521  ORF Transcript_10085/g.18521 Transcript_10085/m.18521 type:complete len:114 (-) Transcript_10085:249-590(-)